MAMTHSAVVSVRLINTNGQTIIKTPPTAYTEASVSVKGTTVIIVVIGQKINSATPRPWYRVAPCVVEGGDVLLSLLGVLNQFFGDRFGSQPRGGAFGGSVSSMRLATLALSLGKGKPNSLCANVALGDIELNARVRLSLANGTSGI
jgi:hypothetical protein